MFLTDIRIPLPNNEAERPIRHAVVGRKNYYSSGSFAGTETAATLEQARDRKRFGLDVN